MVWVPVFQVALLLALPLAVRWVTACWMRRMQGELLRQDEGFRQLRDQLDSLRQECRSLERQQRQLALRRGHLLGQLEKARRELEQGRAPVVAARIAA